MCLLGMRVGGALVGVGEERPHLRRLPSSVERERLSLSAARAGAAGRKEQASACGGALGGLGAPRGHVRSAHGAAARGS